MNDVRIVIPVYNGSEYLARLLEELSTYERSRLIIVDDGSTDDTERILADYDIHVVTHPVNRGKGAALISGAAEAAKLGADFIVTLDGDLQHPVESLTHFMANCSDNQIGLGYRWDRANMPFMRRLSNFITSLLVSVRTGTIIKDSQCGYRTVPLKLFQQFSFHEQGFPFETEMLLKAGLAGYSVKHIPIPTIYSGQSSAISPISVMLRIMFLWLRSYLWL